MNGSPGAVAIAPSITEDAFLDGALWLRQPRQGYRAGLDAVLLAAACRAGVGDGARCLDCGAGVGTVALALARRVDDAHVTLVERDGSLAELAAANALRNGLETRTSVITADLTAPLATLGGLAHRACSFDYVLANPPFHAHGAGTRATDHLKDGSHAMEAGQFDAWVRFAAAMARAGGTFTLIQRPQALPEILTALGRRFGRVRIMPLHPRVGSPASRLLIEATKGSRAGLEVLAGRVLHCGDGHAFSPAFDAILRHGTRLEWG